MPQQVLLELFLVFVGAAFVATSAGIFSDTLYAIIIAMSLLTSVLTPPVLKALFAGMRPESSAVSVHESE